MLSREYSKRNDQSSCTSCTKSRTMKRWDLEVLERPVIDRSLQEESYLCCWSLVLVFWVEDEEAQNPKCSYSKYATTSGLGYCSAASTPVPCQPCTEYLGSEMPACSFCTVLEALVSQCLL